MTSREHFLSLVHPNSLSVAEDFIDGKIDAMFVEYTPKGSYPKGSCMHLRPARSCIEIFENDPNNPSKIIEFNDGEKHMKHSDAYKIYDAVLRYGDRVEYEELEKFIKYKNVRKMLMHRYVKHPEDCSTIVRKKCQKIYESLSDSDKLLLEISDDYDEDL